MGIRTLGFSLLLGLWIIVAPAQQSADTVAGEPDGGGSPVLRDRLTAAQRIAREELERLHEAVNSTDSGDERNIDGFVLSTEVRSFEDIPDSIDREIDLIRNNIRGLIFQVATDIERTAASPGASYDSETGLRYQGLPAEAVAKYQNIVNAKELNNVSVRSVQVAIQLLATINQDLMRDARETTDVQNKRRLYITQAAYIYEMADIVLAILDDIRLAGRDTLERLAAEHQQRVRTRLADIEAELIRVESEHAAGRLSDRDAGNLQKSYQLIIAANRTSLAAWDDLMSQVERQQHWLETTKQHAVSIELKRNAARHQLNTLRDIVLVGEIAPLITMDDLVATIQTVELLELDEAAVYSLLGFRPRR